MQLNNLKVSFKQLNSYANYIISQQNSYSEKGELILQNKLMTDFFLDVISISSGESCTVSIEIGDVDYIKGENAEPIFLKKYTSLLSEVLNPLEIRINKNGKIESFENKLQINEKWDKIKDSVLDNNNYLAEEEKEILIKQTTHLLEDTSLLKQEIESQLYWKSIFPPFYGEYLWLDQETKLATQNYKSIALSNFNVDLDFNVYLEKISYEDNECQISAYGILNPDSVNYTKLLDLIETELELKKLETYNYFVELSYVIGLETGFIKSLDAEIKETFNSEIMYKTELYIDAIS